MATHYDIILGIDIMGEGHDFEDINEALREFFSRQDDVLDDIAPSSFDYRGMM